MNGRSLAVRVATAVLIVQSSGYIVMLWQWAHSYRIIPLDNRPHIPASVKLWQGDSRGRWEGRTLLVDTTNQKANWLDFVGDFHSDALRVTERFTIVDADTIRHEATLDDPKVYTKPWTMRLLLVREKEPGFEILGGVLRGEPRRSSGLAGEVGRIAFSGFRLQAEDLPAKAGSHGCLV
jgi:hypothetical protein